MEILRAHVEGRGIERSRKKMKVLIRKRFLVPYERVCKIIGVLQCEYLWIDGRFSRFFRLAHYLLFSLLFLLSSTSKALSFRPNGPRSHDVARCALLLRHLQVLMASMERMLVLL